jgi:hypothetical protein
MSARRGNRRKRMSCYWGHRRTIGVLVGRPQSGTVLVDAKGE